MNSSTKLQLVLGVSIAFSISTSIAVTSQGLKRDLTLIPGEVACINKYAKDPSHNYSNYAKAIGAPEVADNVHSGLQSCATFTGSPTGSNQVSQYLSPVQYEGGIQMVIQGGPNASFLIGGSPGSATTYAGVPYVARFNPSTGAQLWRTYVPMQSGQWVVAPSGGVIKGGWVMAVFGPNMYKLNPNTGKIVRTVQLPVLPLPAAGHPPTAPPIDANFDGFMLSPNSDGSILMKSQNRPTGCSIQGNIALSTCPSTDLSPVTTVVAVDSADLSILDSINLTQQVSSRPSVANHHGITYMYLAEANGYGTRVIWNPKLKKLTQDLSWNPEYILHAGQTQGAAPVVIGNWVMFTTDGGNAITPPCAVLVSQDDASNSQQYCPFGTSPTYPVTSTGAPGYQNLAGANFSSDNENNMIFVYDQLGPGGVYAAKLDQTTGTVTPVWWRPDWRTSDYFESIGPANHRVLVSQYINPIYTSGFSAYAYTESVIWVDQATGKTLAQSAYTAYPTEQEWMMTPGYGGLLYSLSVGPATTTVENGNSVTTTGNGSLNIYNVESCSPKSVASIPASITNCSTNYSSLPQPIVPPYPITQP